MLVVICLLQFAMLVVGLLQHLNRTECSFLAPERGSVVLECDTCREVHIHNVPSAIILNAIGGCVIGCGLLAVHWRHQTLLYIYGTCMLVVALIVGMSATLTALEAPMLEVAVVTAESKDAECARRAAEMLQGARNHAMLSAVACLVDTTGAVLAIRSRELFTYEEIASRHAEVARASSL